MKNQLIKKTEEVPILQATHGASQQHTLGELDFDCYVLKDGTAVLSGRGMQRVLGLGEAHGTKLTSFLSKKVINAFIDSKLAMAINNPIRFMRPGRGGKAAKGYEATTLTKICRAILSARRAGVFKGNPLYEEIANQAEQIVAAFSDAGIVAYIYEITGYEKIKKPDVLKQIVEAHLAREVREWSKEFPDELFVQMDRIYGNEKTTSRNRPRYYAKFIRKYIYNPLLKGELLKKLDVINPTNEKGIRKHRHHSHTSQDIGLPKIRAQVWQVIGALKVSANKRTFESSFARLMGQTYQGTLSLFEDE